MAQPINQDPEQVNGQWLQRAVEGAGDLPYIWDLTNDAITWVGTPSDLFGPDQDAAPRSGEKFVGRINPEDIPLRLKALSDHFASGRDYDCEYRIRDVSGTFFWVHDRGSAERSNGASPSRLVGSLRPINARKQQEARLARLASYDELTGHLNTLRLREALEHAIAQGRRDKAPSGFLVIGVDGLATINKNLGHEAGDVVIATVGQRLDRFLRSSDVIGRIGGDRFGIVLGRCSDGQMKQAAERILQGVRETPVQTPASEAFVTVSIGGILLADGTTTAYDAMAKAETALKQAKKEGHDRFVAYHVSAEQTEQHRQNLMVGNEVTRALRENRLQFAYQPVVQAVGRETVFHECLLRMRNANGEIVPAGLFIPVIEQLGLIRVIDRYVLDLAVQELGSNPHLHLAINISSLTASDQSWLRSLTTLVKNHSDLAQRLIIEVTETSAFLDMEESARFLSAVRDLGCRVAVDDFGAGFTSFRHLKALTLDIVKIDGSFVRNLADNVDNQLFIRNLLGLAASYGMETVAECVETSEDAKFLVGEGVKYLQGYHIGRPAMGTPVSGRPGAGAAQAAS